ncbi:CocE/NonD family hydrolase [Acidipila sp. EB88]|uniref:CocE/NonD family hydrolase n=1 Tax=Acidipila sp. EB88 TaxID=2305226 RepID=UPI000F5F2051|nr:CocE/NonD family hydrolase [Acidipila sp. EB88]RRA48184.1 CocE/NonD family hydrolase [Acidipila sp. EB88]
MSKIAHCFFFVTFAVAFSLGSMAHAQTGVPAAPQYPAYPSETPVAFKAPTAGMDYERREVMIAMRDGVKLHTVILVPKTATAAKHAGLLLTRTPYSADVLTANAPSQHLGTTLWGYDNAVETIVEGGYIRVVQDIRGKYGSEGDFVMNRPQHGALNPTPVDESTDTYDTIDWLVKNVPESNGKVGVLGISYDGYLSLMPLIHPHPALKVAVPMNPMVDGWMGDDWFHNGAFRQQNLAYIYEQTATRDNSAKWLRSNFDDYDMFMRAGSAGALAKERGMDQIGFWNKVAEHPAYDAFWSGQAVDKVLAAEPLTVPTMVVSSLWDQEDIYGAMAVYRALKDKDPQHQKLFLVMGPWHHGQEIEPASSLGAISFNSDTGLYFREQILAPFLARYLKDDAPAAEVAPVMAFETGTNVWERLQTWPSGCAGGCAPKPTPLYLEAGAKLSLGTKTQSAGYDEFVSDPAKPVPYRARPSQPMGYTPDLSWVRWLVDDQREASGRTDVLTYTGEVLDKPVKISGEPVVHLTASTSGTDADWVVKLIDVYPDEVAGDPQLGGYQLPVAMDIFRGRYRESFAEPKAIEANKPLPYQFALPTTNHVFLPGHRIMVQVQSSWFPLYDRNPQTFVSNIFFARPADYQKATERVFHGSFVELPIVPAGR